MKFCRQKGKNIDEHLTYEIDYVKSTQAAEAMIKRHFDSKGTMKTNCTCGSGKKYKQCHGKLAYGVAIGR